MKTRVVLREDDKLALEQVMAVTGVDSYSDAITLLVTRYADSLCRWWKSAAHDPPCLYTAPEESPLAEREPEGHPIGLTRTPQNGTNNI